MPRASTPVFVGLLLALATAVAYAPRLDHYRDWQSDRSRHFAGQVATSNLDAYTWFRTARELRSGVWHETDLDPLRHYPDGSPRGDAPWLSRGIAFAANWTDGDVYQAGLWLMLATSCLFVIPLALYAASVGWPAAGLLGGLVGAASVAIVGRTSVHRVDTDSINLFALWWICLLYALPKPERGVWRQIAVTVLAGVSVALFIAWYHKPGFYLVLGASFALCLFARRFALRRMALLAAVFLICSNPLVLGKSVRQLSQAARFYVALSVQPQSTNTRASAAGSDWSPLDRMSFAVEEQQRLAPTESLERTLSPPWLAAIGLLAFVGWAARKWRLAAPLLPLAVLGSMGLVTASRFLMYLAPLVGFGLGVLLSIGVRRATRRTRFAGHADAVACALALGAFAVMLPGTAYDWRPENSISSTLVSSLQRCARELPPDAVVWHSWGFGYLVMDVMGAATFTDGGRPDPVIDHLLVKALTGSDTRALQRTIAYLDARPQREVAAAFRQDYPAAYRQLLAEPSEISRPTFLLFTPRSMRDFGAYARRGQWDPASGQPGSQTIRRMLCRRSGRGMLRCRRRSGLSFRINMRRGFVQPIDRAGGESRRILLTKLLVIRDGFVESERRYRHRSDRVAEMVPTVNGRGFEVYTMQGAAFASILNQLYVLGRPDETALELVCDEFPAARLYRVEGTASPLDAPSQM